MRRTPLRLLLLLGMILLTGCTSSARQAPSTQVRYLYVESLDRHDFGLPNVLSALSASNGKLLWTSKHTDQGYSTPVPAQDLVYVGSTDQNVYAFNANDGTLRWHTQIGGLTLVEAVTSGIVLVFADHATSTSEDGLVYALNASSGKVLWHVDLLRGDVKAVADGKVYVETYTQNTTVISALDITTGASFWQYPLPEHENSWALVDGHIYDLGATPPEDILTSALYVISGSTGKLLWRFPNTGKTTLWSMKVADGLVSLVHGGVGPNAGSAMLSALSPGDGSLRWEIPAPSLASSVLGASNGVVYVAGPSSQVAGSQEGLLVALNARDGSQLWQTRFKDSSDALTVRDFTAESEALYATTAAHGLLALNARNGAVQWRYPAADNVVDLTLAGVGDGVVYVAARASNPEPQQVLALSAASGKQLWRYDPPGAFLSSVVVG